ncbi:O-antigen ligase family protein [Volucribacter amazonae]|uniref:O-antigen ligase-related domain-containing protein n=1 Tax=Volucribacter amazonae TaxID=256731 RepID=A0A9X4SHT8_9PAST|nr:O-antigen ligase family protein [Volucribacter amazonae]MDG6894870.1 hypothetical protein [Volucribacter amazonae]
MGLLGIDFFIQQWWIKEKLPRVNGFSYEPSYYATYLYIGWTLLLYLFFKNFELFYKYKYIFIIITLAILLSSSRMSYVMMLSAFLYLFVNSIIKDVINNRKIKRRDLNIILFLFIGIIIISSIFIYNFDDLIFLLHDTGLFGTTSHSVSMRSSDAMNTISVFLESPFIGYSLGGIAPAIAKFQGIIISTQEEAKNFEGMNIFLEMLAAGGILGFLCFILYLRKLFSSSLNIAKNLLPYNKVMADIILAIRFSLFWELVILCFNQNILRPYLWVLIAMLNAHIFLGYKWYQRKIENKQGKI